MTEVEHTTSKIHVLSSGFAAPLTFCKIMKNPYELRYLCIRFLSSFVADNEIAINQISKLIPNQLDILI